MKKNPVLPKPEPRPMAVAVPSLTPHFFLWNSKTGSLDRVLGGFVSDDGEDDSAYIKGYTNKKHRQAQEFERFESEILLLPLPDTIEEVILSENPECKLLITNCKLFELPEAKPEPDSCKVIEHPAAWFARAKKLHRTKTRDGNQLFLFPPSENFSETLNQKTA